MIDQIKANALGIRIKFDDSTPTVISENELHSITKLELKYLLGSDTHFSIGNITNEDAYSQAQSETATLNIQFENAITDVDIKEAATIALNSHETDETPIVKLCNNLLAIAISRRASDIHIDPSNSCLEVKMRFDGVVTKFAELDLRISKMLTARLKLLSGMDITEKRLPQDGRFTVQYRSQRIDIRTATIPVANGERVAIRIFNQNPNLLALEQISLHSMHTNALKQVISKQHGLIIVCGPTGSGKTTTIYSLLSELKGRGQNIMTIEDPIEMEIQGIVQTQVDEDIGFTFSSGLRSLMRNDPDVILVGEIRDQETAVTAVRAAMTGHLVISTVHANTPLGALKRLINLNVDASLLAECLLGIFSQRLIKIYCKNCVDKSVASISHTTKDFNNPAGCDECFHTGFQTRQPVMSHLLVDKTVSEHIENDVSRIAYDNTMFKEANKLYQENMTPFSEVAKLKGI